MSRAESILLCIDLAARFPEGIGFADMLGALEAFPQVEGQVEPCRLAAMIRQVVRATPRELGQDRLGFVRYAD